MASFFLAPSLVQFRAEANILYPNRDKTSDGWIGDVSHSARSSDHNPDANGMVHAYDLDEDLNGDQSDAGAELSFLAEYLRTERDRRIKYVIYEGRIYAGREGPQPWVWRPYSGVNAHRKHMHISILYDAIGENDTSPWFPSQGDDMPTPAELWDHPIQSKVDGANRPARDVLGFAQAQAQSADEKVTALTARVQALEEMLPAKVWEHQLWDGVSGPEAPVELDAGRLISGIHSYAVADAADSDV